MTKVFVHGNPETAAIWSPLVLELGLAGIDDVVLLSPPGFGAPVPPGFEATPSSYVDWLAGELAEIDGPIDLVGHDWGAGHVFGLVAAHPDLVRSFAADCAGLLHPAYDWHDAAKVWQTPGDGEANVETMVGLTADDRTNAYLGLGLSPEIARSMAEGFDAAMGACILTLYRAAVQPALAQLGDRLAAVARPPGLVIDATADAYVGSDLAADVVERLDAEHLQLVGQGHWWMVSEPAAAAAGLAAFWATLN